MCKRTNNSKSYLKYKEYFHLQNKKLFKHRSCLLRYQLLNWSLFTIIEFLISIDDVLNKFMSYHIRLIKIYERYISNVF